jgi:hypothetical protein
MPNAKHTGAKLAAAAGAATLAAAATAYYFAFDKKAAKHRAAAKTWAHKAKAEVISELKKAKAASKPAYEKAVKEVLKKYAEYEKTAPGELKKLQGTLMSHWGKISKMVGQTTKQPAKKTAKKRK